jgi:hypothetical protein
MVKKGRWANKTVKKPTTKLVFYDFYFYQFIVTYRRNAM